MLRTKMEVDVCVALISRRTKEEDSRAVTELEELDSLVDRGTDEESAGEPEEIAGETNNPSPVELNTQGDPGELERSAMTTGSVVGRGCCPQSTLPNFGEDLAQSVSELLPEILPSSQFDGAPVSTHRVTQGDERIVMSGIYRPEIEFEPVNMRNLGSNNALGEIKDDCDENKAICLSQNNSDTFNDTLETREGDKGCLLDCSRDKEHNGNCEGVNLDCSPVKTLEINHRETGFEIDYNFVSSIIKDFCKGEMDTEMGCINEETPVQCKTSEDKDLDIQLGSDLDQAGSVPDLILEEQTSSADTTCNKAENMCITSGCAEMVSGPDTNAEHTCSPDRNVESTSSQDMNVDKACSVDDRNIENACSPDRHTANACGCDKNGETACSPDKNSETVCGSDRSNQLALCFPSTEVEGRAESLSPTVNLDFGAVYWTKDKAKADKDEETAGNVLPASRRGLHVSFANEESLVSGCMEPAIPWMEAWLCSTPELVFAYKTACESVGVKPLKKLLVQLEGVRRFDVRSDLLSLKGESLDCKHCETLEAIFKRVQFDTINIEEMRLDDEVAVTMFDLLQYYQSCLRLIMNRSTNLGTRGWQAWTRLMKQSTGLQHLEARGLSIPDHTLPVIGKYLRTGSMLRTLQLENSIRSGRHLNLLAAAMKTSQSVQELYLGDNQLMPADGLQLGTMLKGNSSLRLLDIRNNLLQDTGMTHICDGVTEQADVNGLNTLVVWNNQISHQSMPALSRALAATKSLETLNIGHNNITNDGIHRLKDGLMQNKTLLRIGLQATKISCEGAVALAEFVAESSKLVRLDLRENSIKTGGLMALSLSLRVNQTVTCVDLDKEPKKESGMRDYAEQQRRLLSDIISFATRNSLLVNASDEQRDKGHDLESPSDKGDVTSGLKNDAGDEGTEASASTRATCLSLSLIVPTRCETLESPSYSPEHLSLLSSPTDWDDVKAETGSASLPVLNQKPPTTCESADASVAMTPPVNVVSLKPGNITAGDAPSSVTSLSKAQLQDSNSASAEESKTSTLAPTVQKPPVPQKPAAPPDKKLVRSQKRKFTISKAVLPSAMSPKPVTSTAVLFTARPSSVSEDGHLDSDTHVCIVGTSLPDASSNAGDLSKKSGNEIELHPLVRKFSTSMLSDLISANDVALPSDSIVAADATVDEVRSDSSVAGVSPGENKETVVMDTTQPVAAETGTASFPTDAGVPKNADVQFPLQSLAWVSSALVSESTLTTTSVSTAKEGHLDLNIREGDQSRTDPLAWVSSALVSESTLTTTSVSTAKEGHLDLNIREGDQSRTDPLAWVSSALVSESTLTTTSVSMAKEGHLDLNIPEGDRSRTDPSVGDLSTNVAGDENHLLIDVLGVADLMKELYPAERGQSLTDVHVVGRDHSVVSTGTDCSSTCTDMALDDGQSLAKVFEQHEHSLLMSVACANETESTDVISVTSKSLECRETSSSDPNVTAKETPDIVCCTQVNYNAENECAYNETHSLASSCSEESITGVGSASLKLERWSMQTDDESANFLVLLAHLDGTLLSENPFKTVGNNGQDCVDLSLGVEDFKKSNSVSSSEGTDTAVSDCEDFRTASEGSESEYSDMESTRRKTGSAEKSSDDDRLIAASDESLVFEGNDRLLEAVSTAVSSLVSETKLVYSVNNLKHDVLDSVNANTSTSEQ